MRESKRSKQIGKMKKQRIKEQNCNKQGVIKKTK